ncbi:MAG: metal-dependent hydrolase [Acidobacteria bacterium]|nr:metal-dependent hydrolase [Acidobacteriota bacterium]
MLTRRALLGSAAAALWSKDKTTIRFFGVSGYEIVNGRGQRILIDPFLDENPGCAVKSAQLGRPDLILVTHAAFDHLGDTEAIARRTGAPVVCGGDTRAYLLAKGIPGSQVRATIWGVAVEVAGIRVQPVECHHASNITLPNGSIASAPPLAFVVHVSDALRFYHHGDTGLFSDMKLIAELHKPNVGAVGVALPGEIMHRFAGAGKMVTGEMTPREAVMATEWLGLETVLPCHYIDPKSAHVREFARLMTGRGARVVILGPGETHTA